ncbi:hypothetical protein PUN4_450111 [Paraburkholderia unamae]|nr:hypothetical protein PUN4_450111 [Paraburkholderia unamae]
MRCESPQAPDDLDSDTPLIFNRYRREPLRIQGVSHSERYPVERGVSRRQHPVQGGLLG